MPYNPSVQDITGQIYATGGANAARINLAGTQAMADGISKGMDKAGAAIAGGIQNQELTAQEVGLLMGKADAYHSAGLIETPDFEKFMQGNIATKRQIISMADTAQAINQQQQRDQHTGAVIQSTLESTRGVKQGNDQQQLLIDAQKFHGSGVIKTPNGRTYKRDANGAFVPLSMNDSFNQPDASWVNNLAFS